MSLLGIAAASATDHGPLKIPNSQLETMEWSEVGGWDVDNHAVAFAAFMNSCKVMVRGTPPGREKSELYIALQSVCRRAHAAMPKGDEAARYFFEQNFRPMRIAPLGEDKGFLTGYYEPIVEGSLKASEEYNVPLYRTPPNLALRTPKKKVASASVTGWRRNANRNTGFFYDRTAIEEGALAGRNLEICYLKDPTDLFFAQIQGSARVRLPDGKILRLNYDSQNGWPYTPIGRVLIERNIVPRDQMSMDRIREWMAANPAEGKELRRHNKSWVFFRETSLGDNEEPPGAQGVPLTPGRSIAVDRFLHIYGTPFFIDAELPIESDKPGTKFRRLMISQDTGGAILGPARADLYFGSGDGSASIAGRIRHQGQFVMLVPRDIDPVVMGARTPIPRVRPALAKIEVPAEKPAKEKSSKDSKEKPAGRVATDQKKDGNPSEKGRRVQ
jgi:membrane-bound lytic murein transglycosylase A